MTAPAAITAVANATLSLNIETRCITLPLCASFPNAPPFRHALSILEPNATVNCRRGLPMSAEPMFYFGQCREWSVVTNAVSRAASAMRTAGLRSHFRNAKLATLLYLISDYVSLLTEKDEVRVECCRASSLLELSHWPVTCVGGRLCMRQEQACRKDQSRHGI